MAYGYPYGGFYTPPAPDQLQQMRGQYQPQQMPVAQNNLLGGGQQNGGFMQLVQQFNQFKQTFSGDPRQKVQELLNSGQMSQDQYNQLASMATELQNLLK